MESLVFLNFLSKFIVVIQNAVFAPTLNIVLNVMEIYFLVHINVLIIVMGYFNSIYQMVIISIIKVNIACNNA